MDGITLGWIAETCRGRLQAANARTAAKGVSIDSRRIKSGDLFVVLPGENVDGHAFIPAAVRAGAAAVLCRQAPASAPAILVPDPRRALGMLAAAYRLRFPRLLVAGVTGSAGKTATKDMLAAVLARRFRVLATEGNLNNNLGLPLTLLKLTRRHTAAVLEMGMSASGEIRNLAAMSRPAIGVITNVGDAHLGHFRSRREIADAKAELLAALPAGGWAVINADDPLLARRGRKPRLTFGQSAQADVRVVSAQARADGTRVTLAYRRQRASMRLGLLGAHHAWNAAAAVAAGLAARLPFTAACSALEGYRPRARMRLELQRLGPHRLLNDAYNSNPQSAAAGLALLLDLPARGKKWVVAGSMLELGRASRAAHEELGRTIARSGVAGLVAVGAEAKALAAAARRAGLSRVASLPDASGAGRVLARWLSRAGDLILIKGSRAIRLEKTVEDLNRLLGGKSVRRRPKT